MPKPKTKLTSQAYLQQHLLLYVQDMALSDDILRSLLEKELKAKLEDAGDLKKVSPRYRVLDTKRPAWHGFTIRAACRSQTVSWDIVVLEDYDY